MLIAPIPTAGPTPGNLWFAPLRSAKHAASNVWAEPGLAPVHSASTDSSTRSAPTAANRLTTAQGLVKWPSRRETHHLVPTRCLPRSDIFEHGTKIVVETLCKLFSTSVNL